MLLVWLTFFTVIEEIYAKIFGKPIYIHFYPFPKKLTDDQLKILSREFYFYQRLPEVKKRYFEHRVAHFIKHHQFIGNEDFEVTNQVCVLIAATSCMLTFGMRHYLYQEIRNIIIYPSSYFSTISGEYHKGEFNPRMKAIVFSWEDFLQGFQISNDNLNLGLHEFGHALHYCGLRNDDISALLFAKRYAEIIRNFNDKDYQQRLIESGYFRIYAYTNQFEFLSVVLEHYFETPLEFKKEFPELFQKVSEMLNHKHQTHYNFLT